MSHHSIKSSESVGFDIQDQFDIHKKQSVVSATTASTAKAQKQVKVNQPSSPTNIIMSRQSKPYKELSQCSYDDYLKYNQTDFIKIGDYVWMDNELFYIIDKVKDTFVFANLETNKIIKKTYPFYYCKIDGNDPMNLIMTYKNIQEDKENYRKH